jgi:hypothetical protein
MLKTIEGIYQDGQIRFTELPQGIVDQSQVLVTFLTPGSIDSIKLRQLIDQLETIEGIQQGFKELNSGQTRPIDEFMKDYLAHRPQKLPKKSKTYSSKSI